MPALPLAEPEEVGLSGARLARLTATFETAAAAGRIPGAVIAVARGGRLAHLAAVGHRDPVGGDPMRPDTLFWLASMTKPMTVAGALVLVERGRLALADPVARHLPELADRELLGADGRRVPSARQPTVLDLMRHTNGMVEGMRGDTPVHRAYQEAFGDGMTALTGEEFVGRLAGCPLLHEPGAMWHYGFGIDVLGLIIESITGRTLGEHLAEEVFGPLGMRDTGFGVPEGAAGRYAAALPRDPDTGRPQALPDLSRARFESGGAGAVGTAGDFLRFAQALLGGGALGDARILGRKTVELMTADHLGPDTDDRLIGEIDPGYAGHGFGLGVTVRRRHGLATTAGSPGEYSWPGAGGTYWWADPREELCAVLCAHTPNRTDRSRAFQWMKTLVTAAIVD
ncbi:serine hydrolase domain-containing protein [Pseudonocardia acaciae]|uniref:serine hydrolase domain-containing protein n=1 Tax=Pseudonocardia acaciae TaxID=551276 RepID=UPI000684319E|nr:serine hydrolase domain-containing protein [Pseudonocardia acaciae]